jgi:hypothetical protein
MTPLTASAGILLSAFACYAVIPPRKLWLWSIRIKRRMRRLGLLEHKRARLGTVVR